MVCRENSNKGLVYRSCVLYLHKPMILFNNQQNHSMLRPVDQLTMVISNPLHITSCFHQEELRQSVTTMEWIQSSHNEEFIILYTPVTCGVITGMENALLDTREQGARAKTVKVAGSMKIREHGAHFLSVKRQKRANWKQIQMCKQAYTQDIDQKL